MGVETSRRVSVPRQARVHTNHTKHGLDPLRWGVSLTDHWRKITGSADCGMHW